MNKIPIPDDLEAEDFMALVQDDAKDAVAEKLQTTTDRLAKLIHSNPDALEMMRNLMAEIEVWGKLQAMLMVPQALTTLSEVMIQTGENAKNYGPRVKAAEIILDRTYLPKQTVKQVQNLDTIPKHSIPTIDDLLQNAEDDSQALNIIHRHKALVNEIEALRRNAKEIIDVRPENKNGS